MLNMLSVFSLDVGLQITFSFVFFCIFLDFSNNVRCFRNQKGSEHYQLTLKESARTIAHQPERPNVPPTSLLRSVPLPSLAHSAVTDGVWTLPVLVWLEMASGIPRTAPAQVPH